MFESRPSEIACPHLVMEICRDNDILDRMSMSKVELALPCLKPAGGNKQLDHHVGIECLLMFFLGTSSGFEVM